LETLGFKLYASMGTADYYTVHGVPVSTLKDICKPTACYDRNWVETFVISVSPKLPIVYAEKSDIYI